MRTLLAAALVIAALPLVAQTSAAGEWEASFITPLGPRELTIYLAQDGERLTGHLTSESGEAAVKGSVSGADVKLSWSFDEGGRTIEVRITGRIEGDSIKGTAQLVGVGEGPFTAERTGQ